MRSDMVPGAVLPDYELSDHAASSPSCKDRIRWFSYSAAEVSVPRTAGRERGLFSSIVSSTLPIAGLCAGSNDAAAAALAAGDPTNMSWRRLTSGFAFSVRWSCALGCLRGPWLAHHDSLTASGAGAP
jgi:hypothetical protein